MIAHMSSGKGPVSRGAWGQEQWKLPAKVPFLERSAQVILDSAVSPCGTTPLTVMATWCRVAMMQMLFGLSFLSAKKKNKFKSLWWRISSRALGSDASPLTCSIYLGKSVGVHGQDKCAGNRVSSCMLPITPSVMTQLLTMFPHYSVSLSSPF